MFLDIPSCFSSMMPRSSFSSDRIRCADYKRLHKKVIYKKHGHSNFRQVKDFASTLRRLGFTSASTSDELCYSCYKHYETLVNAKTGSASYGENRGTSQEDATFVPSEELVQAVNESVSALEVDITPLKLPSAIRTKRRRAYGKRKQHQVASTLSSIARMKIQEVYELSSTDSASSGGKCQGCEEWQDNVRQALSAADTHIEKTQLLTLLPETMSRQDALKNFPSATKYLIDKARAVKKERGIWGKSDPYLGHAIPSDHITIARDYYLDDNMDCSRQSPNKSDVINVFENGEKTKKVKRFMTRTLKETFRIFKKAHPAIKIGHSKFYSLRPKWVKMHPSHEVCICIYCNNMELCCTALSNFLSQTVNMNDLFQLCLCPVPSDACWLQECQECQGSEGISVESLNLDDCDSQEIHYAMWENGFLIKKTTPIDAFVEEVTKWTLKMISHQYIRNIQRLEVKDAKSKCKEDNSILIMHFDFAENWTVILQNEVQSYHWVSSQLSIFTCVAYWSNTVANFAVVSDDLLHDTAHAHLAMTTVESFVATLHGRIFQSITYVSDGAASHFKNRFQLYELKTIDTTTERKWLFTATGHGKGPCDGIGGLVKHHATFYNLTHDPIDSIQTPMDLNAKMTPILKNVNFLLLPLTTVQDYRNKKKEEWTNLHAAKGIQRSHYWSSKNGQLFMARTARHEMMEVI